MAAAECVQKFVGRRSMCVDVTGASGMKPSFHYTYLFVRVQVCVCVCVCARACVLNKTGIYVCRKMLVAPSNQKPSCM